MGDGTRFSVEFSGESYIGFFLWPVSLNSTNLGMVSKISSSCTSWSSKLSITAENDDITSGTKPLVPHERICVLSGVNGLKAQYYASCASVIVLVFMGARRLLFSSSILAANKRILRISNITKIAAKRSQHVVLNGQHWVFKYNRNLRLFLMSLILYLLF